MARTRQMCPGVGTLPALPTGAQHGARSLPLPCKNAWNGTDTSLADVSLIHYKQPSVPLQMSGDHLTVSICPGSVSLELTFYNKCIYAGNLAGIFCVNYFFSFNDN